jgi:preprotein translocase subunit SecB
MAENAAPQPEQQAPSFQIEKVYVKDLSLEIPNAPQVFMEQNQPQLEVQIGAQSANVTDAFFEVTVTATVTAKAGERTLFLVEAVQAGIFSIRNVAPEELDPLLGIACPNVLFPYLRETISDVITRGGFPPVLLSPISFEAIYMQRLQQQQAQQPQAQPAAGPKIEISR